MNRLIKNNQGLTTLDGIELNENLEMVDLGCNRLKDISRLTILTNLQTLNLWMSCNNEIEPLIHLKKMTHLNVGYCGLKEIGILSQLTQLTYLVINCNPIREIDGLSKLTNLRTLGVMTDLIDNWNPLLALTQLTNLHNTFEGGCRKYEADIHFNKLLINRNLEIQWNIVRTRFLQYCLGLASLDLPVLVIIEIFVHNSYPNHLYKKWQLAKIVKDRYLIKIESIENIF